MRAVWARHQNLLLWLWRSCIFLAALAWMGLIFQLSSLSQEEASAPLEAPVIAWLGVARSYLAHLVLYGVLATMVQMNFWAWTNAGMYRLRWALLAAALASLYGVTDEYHQSLVPGRVASSIDMWVNATGAAITAAGLWLLALASKRLYPPESAS
ncbi:MAG: VanZ family protein [Chloroflexi bacterium]|nr:VanZ family protein [Chloroflexota bacterium]MCI0784922.1 VanZ family protein [Chloroflexota bacterium]MCI0792326.1 VanZ family protein [Chloroflexota bacterium]MCI0857334.1 VanZ family protein [Chloroflexota bacterium]MCI0865639.1 VanZ family protein [Chloroflexota bacterium]